MQWVHLRDRVDALKLQIMYTSPRQSLYFIGIMTVFKGGRYDSV